EREETHANAEPSLRHGAFEAVEDREPRCRELGLRVAADDRAHEQRRVALRSLTAQCAVTTVGHQAARQRWKRMDDAKALEIATTAAFRGGRAARDQIGPPGNPRRQAASAAL